MKCSSSDGADEQMRDSLLFHPVNVMHVSRYDYMLVLGLRFFGPDLPGNVCSILYHGTEGSINININQKTLAE